MIVFAATCHTCTRLSIVLRALGFRAVPLHGQLSQQKRLGALNRFKSNSASILIATDVASRGLVCKQVAKALSIVVVVVVVVVEKFSNSAIALLPQFDNAFTRIYHQ
eukprot:SAG31_NODE_2042_length_6589_cov_10.177504_6_plen_107_part_00